LPPLKKEMKGKGSLKLSAFLPLSAEGILKLFPK
jgi:hypothetical protein